MRRVGKKTGRILAAALTASMIIPGSVMADGPDAAEELKDILDRYQEMQSQSLLKETLGYEELCERIDDNGLELVIQAGLTDETVDQFALEDQIPKGSWIRFDTRINPKTERWMLASVTGQDTTEGADLFELYGDKDLLSLIAPYLYEGAVAIRSGSFREQFEGSALQTLLEVTEEIPDFDLQFYLDEEEVEYSPVKLYQEQMEEQAEQIGENMKVEKTETDEATVYTAHVRTADVMELYGTALGVYYGTLEESGLVTDSEMNAFEAELDEMLGQMERMLGEEIVIDFHTTDGLLAKASCEFFVDPTVVESAVDSVEAAEEELAGDAGEAAGEELAGDAGETAGEELAGDAGEECVVDAGQDSLETPLTQIEEETLAEAGMVSLDTSLETSGEAGYVSYEVSFADPEQPAQKMNINMEVSDIEGNEILSICMTQEKQDIESGTGERTTLSMEMREAGSTVYSGTPFWMEYDVETGDLDAWLEIQSTETGEVQVGDTTELQEVNKTVTLMLDSNISGVYGDSFVWEISNLSMESDGLTAGLCGSVSVSTEPGNLAAPENPRMLFELDEAALMGLLTEISYNLDALSGESETELDREYSNMMEDESVWSSDDAAADDQAVSIIGGADGPTSVFIAGKVG